MQENLTTEQKIDFIYEKTLAREKRDKNAIMLKWGFRIFMILYLMYFFFFALPWMIDSFKDTITPDFSSVGIDSDAMKKVSEFLNR